ncbi:unnamed protein product, partial [Rotaria magnacalcarata]
SLQNGGQNKSDQSDRDERFIVREKIQRHCAHQSEVLQRDKEDFILFAIPIVPIDVNSLRRLAEIPNIGASLDRNERFMMREENMSQILLDEVSDHDDGVLDRAPQNVAWSKKYFCHGDESDVIADVTSDVDGCVQSRFSEDLSSSTTSVDQIRLYFDQILQGQMKIISDQEKATIQQLIVEQKRLLYKLETQMTKNLDQLQNQMSSNQKTIRQIQIAIQANTNKAIQRYLAQRSVQVAAKKVETMGIEQLRTLNLQVYSTARTFDEKEGCQYRDGVLGKSFQVVLIMEITGGFGFNPVLPPPSVCSTMGGDVLSIRTSQRWFNRFKNDNFELDDLPHSGRPMELDVDLLKQLIDGDPRLTLRCLAEQLGCSHTAVEKHLNELGKTWKYGV